MELGLEGFTVLITGASGAIGSATARAFAREGVTVVVHYHRNRRAAEELAAEIRGVPVGADLTDEDDTAALIALSVARTTRLDAVVANAGVWPSEPQPLWTLPVDRWRATVDANLTATFLTVRAFLRHVAERVDEVPAPSIVMTASTAGLFGEAGHADYAAAKAGIATGLLRSVKNEIVTIHPRGRANVVAPGWTSSPMIADTLDAETLARVTSTAALRKVATPEDVAQAIVWLTSPVAAGHVTGEVLTIAGGMEGRLLHPPPAPPPEA